MLVLSGPDSFVKKWRCSLRSGPPQDSGPSEEVLPYYRLMGLDYEATYDEIETAYNTLLAQYTKEPKKKIKLQVPNRSIPPLPSRAISGPSDQLPS